MIMKPSSIILIGAGLTAGAILFSQAPQAKPTAATDELQYVIEPDRQVSGAAWRINMSTGQVSYCTYQCAKVVCHGESPQAVEDGPQRECTPHPVPASKAK